jgi:RteC protein
MRTAGRSNTFSFNMTAINQLLQELGKIIVSPQVSGSDASLHTPEAMPTIFTFNGHSMALAYSMHLHHKFMDCAAELENLLFDPTQNYCETHEMLHALSLQVDKFIRLYLSTENRHLLYTRVHWESDAMPDLLADPQLQRHFQEFLLVEKHFLKNLQKLLKKCIKQHRTFKSLRRKKITQEKKKGKRWPALVDQDGTPLLKWKKDKVDLIELVASLQLVGAFERIDQEQLSRKDLFDFFSFIFNYPIKHPENALEAARNRKNHTDKFATQLGASFVEFSRK